MRCGTQSNLRLVYLITVVMIVNDFADGFIESRGRFKAQRTGTPNTHFCPLIALLFYFCIFLSLLTDVVFLSPYSSVQYFISKVSLRVN